LADAIRRFSVACIVSGALDATKAVGMLETTGGSSVDRNIDVKFKNVERQSVGSMTWHDFGTPNITPIDPSYSFDLVSSTEFRIPTPRLVTLGRDLVCGEKIGA